MVKKDLVGFAVLLARVSARPQIVILIPQVSYFTLVHMRRSTDFHVVSLKNSTRTV